MPAKLSGVRAKVISDLQAHRWASPAPKTRYHPARNSTDRNGGLQAGNEGSPQRWLSSRARTARAAGRSENPRDVSAENEIDQQVMDCNTVRGKVDQQGRGRGDAENWGIN